MKNIFHLLSIACFVALLIFIACEESPTDEGEPEEIIDAPLFQAELIGYYMNANGDNPQFSVSSDSINGYVTYDGLPELQVDTGNRLVSITLNGVSIADDTSNHKIDSVVVHEEIEGLWVYYPEFSVEQPRILSSVAVILILDVSSSLGSDFETLKMYAKQFVNIIFENNPSNTQVGIIDFATDVHTFPLTSNVSELYSYIDSLQKGEYTRMYDAMQIGITQLLAVSVEGKAMVTFTDGRDNYSETTPDGVKTLLYDSGIASYTLGLKGRGGIEENALRQLAINGRYSVASSMSDLERTFRFFAESFKSIYSVTYFRNDQIINELRRIKFTFMDLNEK